MPSRVSAVVGLIKLAGYKLEGKRARLQLLEKGNKEEVVWLHREAEEYLVNYVAEVNRRRFPNDFLTSVLAFGTSGCLPREASDRLVACGVPRHIRCDRWVS
jgi:hypothetical protein